MTKKELNKLTSIRYQLAKAEIALSNIAVKNAHLFSAHTNKQFEQAATYAEKCRDKVHEILSPYEPEEQTKAQ